MKKIIVHNCTDEIVEIILVNKKEYIINPNDSVNILLDYNNTTCIIKEKHMEYSNIYKFLEIILGVVISIPLWFINCLNFETIEQSIKLPVKYELLDNCCEDDIFIYNSSEKLKSYDLKINNKLVSGEIEFSQLEIEKQLKEYNKSFIISLAFPIIVIIALIIISICLQSLVLGIVSLFVLLIQSFYLIRIGKANIRVLKRIYSKSLDDIREG